MGSAETQSVLKAARQKCYQARDSFYNCVQEQGVAFTSEPPTVPSKCKATRKAFTTACKPSWVKHFDLTHDKELRLLQTLRQNINKSESTATGKLAGQPQN